MPGRFGLSRGDHLDGCIEFLRLCRGVLDGRTSFEFTMTPQQAAAAALEGAVIAANAYRQLSLIRIGSGLTQDQLAAVLAQEEALDAQVTAEAAGYIDNLMTEIMADSASQEEPGGERQAGSDGAGS
jgi:hypothetical protein